MTHQQCAEYCITHKVTGIEPLEHIGFKVMFAGGLYISIGANLGGITYTHVCEEVIFNDEQILQDINKSMPNLYEEMSKKYPDLFPPKSPINREEKLYAVLFDEKEIMVLENSLKENEFIITENGGNTIIINKKPILEYNYLKMALGNNKNTK